MNKTKYPAIRFLSDGHLNWVFILPSAILLALFALPLFALFVRSIDKAFLATRFQNRHSEALQLSF